MDLYKISYFCFKFIVLSFISAASVILEKIIGVLVGKELLTIERLEMLITSNLRTLCFSWLDLSRRDKDEHDTKCVDILNQTSVICPVIII